MRLGYLLAALVLFVGCAPASGALELRVGEVRYEVDPATVEIHARTHDGAPILVLPALVPAGESWSRDRDGEAWRWRDGHGGEIVVRVDGPALSVGISHTSASALNLALPTMALTDTWIVPDGEGLMFSAGDPFWRNTPGAGSYHEEHCLNATGGLSMPAWSRVTGDVAVTYMLADGLQSELCLHDAEGVQGRLTHDFSPGAEHVELLLEVGAVNPLAPALAYRDLLKRRGLFRTFADKPAPLLPRLFGAQHAYAFGDALQPAFLDRLHALGIERMVVITDDAPTGGPIPPVGHAGPDYLAHAEALGFLSGPYELFGNAQSPQTADDPVSNWGNELFPAGCIQERSGTPATGFANRGCNLSSEALRQRTTAPNIASRYAQHVQDGASTVFIDSDAFGEFFADYSAAHPMTMARDRDNLYARLSDGITHYHFVLGSEHVHAWSHAVAHYSHGGAQSHVIWRVQADHDRFGNWWPPQRPGIFFKTVDFTPVEARAMFGAVDRVPLFEAAFHDSVVSTDRWEYGLMKVRGLERLRFARALLYGTPTMWSLDDRELTRVGPWLKAAYDDFRVAHGWDAPAALTGFAWLTPDRLVQQTTFADGRVIVANFTDAPWQGLGSDCVRVTRREQQAVDLCPPELLAPAH